MIGKLVAIRIDETGDFLQVTGQVAQEKNRKAAWTFRIEKSQARDVPEMVEALENDRVGRAEAQGG